MATEDQTHWDSRYRDRSDDKVVPALPQKFAAFAELIGTAETTLEIACGDGRASVWLAMQGAQVIGYDISAVAIALAERLAEQYDVADRCTFVAIDLDDGLPAGPEVDLVLCNMFRDPGLDASLIDRLRPAGLLAIAALSEVGAAPGRFRTAPGELTHAFRSLDSVADDERDGVAWLLARKR